MSAPWVKDGSNQNEEKLMCAHTTFESSWVSGTKLAQIKKGWLEKNLNWALNLYLTNRRKVSFSRRNEKQTKSSEEQGDSNNILIMVTVIVSMFKDCVSITVVKFIPCIWFLQEVIEATISVIPHYTDERTDLQIGLIICQRPYTKWQGQVLFLNSICWMSGYFVFFSPFLSHSLCFCLSFSLCAFYPFFYVYVCV